MSSPRDSAPDEDIEPGARSRQDRLRRDVRPRMAMPRPLPAVEHPAMVTHVATHPEPAVASRVDVAETVQRARSAQRAIADYTQEQVDELVTAVAWSVVRPDRAEELARLAVDEGGFGNYADKVVKIQK